VCVYVDIDECATDSGGCDDNSDCVNSVGSFTCECHAGHARNGGDTCEGCRSTRTLQMFWRTTCILLA